MKTMGASVFVRIVVVKVGIVRLTPFSYNFCSSMKIVGATGLGSLWALEWA